MHPYQLSRTLRQHGDDRSVKFTHGSLYMVVQQLERAGFVRAQGTAREGQRPERTLYGLTDAGRAELKAWMRDIVAEPAHEYPQYVAALSMIGALPPGEVVDLLSARLRGLAAMRAEARALRDGAIENGVHPLFLVEEEYRIALLDADAAFTRQFIERIRGADGWASQWQERHDTFTTHVQGDPE
jgi:DNA-binding PadR family transcriptional regulator